MMSKIVKPTHKCEKHPKKNNQICYVGKGRKRSHKKVLLLQRQFKLIVDAYIFAQKCLILQDQPNNSMMTLKLQYQTLKGELEQLFKEIEQKFKIQPNDSISIFLQQKGKCTKNEIINMADQLDQLESFLIKKNELTTNYYENLNNKLEQTKMKFQELKNINLNRQVNNDLNIVTMNIIDEFQQTVNDIQFNRTNSLMAVGGIWNETRNSNIQIYSINDQKQYSFLCNLEGNQLKLDVNLLCFSHSDDSLFSVNTHSQILFWKQSSPNKWEIHQCIEVTTNPIKCIQLDIKHNFLVVGNNGVSLFKLNNQDQWKINQYLQETERHQIISLNFSEQCKFLAALNNDKLFYLYEVDSNNYKWFCKFDLQDKIQCLYFTNETDCLILLQNHKIIFYELQKEEYEKTIEAINQVRSICSAQFNRITSTLAVEDKEAHKLLFYSIKDKTNLIMHSYSVFLDDTKIFSSRYESNIALYNEGLIRILSIKKRNVLNIQIKIIQKKNIIFQSKILLLILKNQIMIRASLLLIYCSSEQFALSIIFDDQYKKLIK